MCRLQVRACPSIISHIHMGSDHTCSIPHRQRGAHKVAHLGAELPAVEAQPGDAHEGDHLIAAGRGVACDAIETLQFGQVRGLSKQAGTKTVRGWEHRDHSRKEQRSGPGVQASLASG